MKERIKFILYLRGVKESHLVEGHPPFFLVKRRMHFLILGRSVGRIEKKKNLKKKNHKKSRNRRRWCPRTTLKVVKVNFHIFGQIKRIISSENWFNYVVLFFFFFF